MTNRNQYVFQQGLMNYLKGVDINNNMALLYSYLEVSIISEDEFIDQGKIAIRELYTREQLTDELVIYGLYNNLRHLLMGSNYHRAAQNAILFTLVCSNNWSQRLVIARRMSPYVEEKEEEGNWVIHAYCYPIERVKLSPMTFDAVW